MSTSRHLGLSDPATQSALLAVNAVVFMIVAVLLMISGNQGAGAVFLAIGAFFLAFRQTGPGPGAARSATR